MPSVPAWRLIAAQTLSKLGDRAVDAKTVLPTLLSGAGAPVWMSGLLVPLRESGSLLLQAVVAPWVRRQPADRVWRIGSLGQGICAIGMGVAALTLEAALLGAVVLLLLALFALSRSLSSISGKLILADVAERDQRGSVTGTAAMIGGLLTLLLAGIGMFAGRGLDSLALIGPLLLAAGLLWWASAPIVPAAGRENDADADDEPLGAWALLRSDAVLRRFVIARGLLLGSALAGPYLLLLARQHEALDGSQLSTFVLAGATASVVGGWVWGRWANHSSRQVISVAGAAAALLVLALALWVGIGDGLGGSAHWLLPLSFLLLSLAHEGIRIGRKTYIVNIAPDDRRSGYVATSNAAIGAVLLLVGGLSALFAPLSIPWSLAGLGTLALAGAWLGIELPEAES